MGFWATGDGAYRLMREERPGGFGRRASTEAPIRQTLRKKANFYDEPFRMKGFKAHERLRRFAVMRGDTATRNMREPIRDDSGKGESGASDRIRTYNPQFTKLLRYRCATLAYESN